MVGAGRLALQRCLVSPSPTGTAPSSSSSTSCSTRRSSATARSHRRARARARAARASTWWGAPERGGRDPARRRWRRRRRARGSAAAAAPIWWACSSSEAETLLAGAGAGDVVDQLVGQVLVAAVPLTTPDRHAALLEAGLAVGGMRASDRAHSAFRHEEGAGRAVAAAVGGTRADGAARGDDEVRQRGLTASPVPERITTVCLRTGALRGEVSLRAGPCRVAV